MPIVVISVSKILSPSIISVLSAYRLGVLGDHSFGFSTFKSIVTS